MAKRPIEEHLADFLMTQKGPAFKDYRRRCLIFWREYYGEQVAMRVEAIVRDRWGASDAEESLSRESLSNRRFQDLRISLAWQS